MTVEFISIPKSELEGILRNLLNEHGEKEKKESSPDVMTIAEVAKYLKVSEPTVRKAIRDNGFPYSDKLGDKRFLKADVDRWLSANQI